MYEYQLKFWYSKMKVEKTYRLGGQNIGAPCGRRLTILSLEIEQHVCNNQSAIAIELSGKMMDIIIMVMQIQIRERKREIID